MYVYINSTWLPAWPWQLPGFGRYTWWRLAVVAKLSCTKTSWPQGLLPWSTFHEVAYVTARRLIKTHGQGKLRILGRRLRLWDSEGNWRQDETSTLKLYAAGFRGDMHVPNTVDPARKHANRFNFISACLCCNKLNGTESLVFQIWNNGKTLRMRFGMPGADQLPGVCHSFGAFRTESGDGMLVSEYLPGTTISRICRSCFGGNQFDWSTTVGSSGSILDLMIPCRFMTYSISWFWLIDFA